MMRRSLAVVTLLTLAATAAPAQGPVISVVGGFVSAKASVSGGEGSVSFDSRTGFAAGVSLAFPVSPTVSVVPEAIYLTKGFEFEDSGDALGIKLGYIEVPVLVRAEFGTGSARPFVMAGPAVAFKLSCDITIDVDGVGSGSSDCDEDTEEDSGSFKSIDFGAVVGGGVTFGRFGVQVRYDLGLANIADTDEDFSYKNRALMVLGSISF